MICDLCPRGCDIAEGMLGFCGARRNLGGEIICDNYGKITAIALDPIEKKPLKRFFPGTKILSVGSYGCNMRCHYCQNHSISMKEITEHIYLSPEKLVQTAEEMKKNGNIGIAFTYNEPLISYEYILDTGVLAKKRDLEIVLVTNGIINERPLRNLLRYVDAVNIDLKGFSHDYYRKLGGNLETVKETIKLAHQYCHVEIASLIVPGENDDVIDMDEMTLWLANIDKNIPLHINRFFPCYKAICKEPTDIETLILLKEIASRHLKYVYLGNC